MNSGEWLEWQNPWWFLLLVPLIFGLFLRTSIYHLKKAHEHLALFFSRGIRQRLKRLGGRINHRIVLVCRLIALVMLVFVLVDITRAYVVTTEEMVRHRIFVLIDSSSSMYGFYQTSFSSITCKTNGRFFPRIHGVCRSLYRLLDEVERSAALKGPDSKDQIAIGQFATESYVVSYLTDDYERLRERVDRLEFYSANILGVATNMHLAIWDMYLMAFERNRDRNSHYTYLSDEDLRKLAAALAPGPPGSALALPEELKIKLEKVKRELRDTTFIVITDAVMSYLTSRVEWGTPQSIRRQMQLGEYLEVPWYFLSTDEFYPELARLARLTGYGPIGSKNRGDFLMVKQEGDFAEMQALMSRILQSRLDATVKTTVERRESWAPTFAIVALTLLAFSVVWKKTFSRSLTESE